MQRESQDANLYHVDMPLTTSCFITYSSFYYFLSKGQSSICLFMLCWIAMYLHRL